jgi:hypothetical protein
MGFNSFGLFLVSSGFTYGQNITSKAFQHLGSFLVSVSWFYGKTSFQSEVSNRVTSSFDRFLMKNAIAWVMNELRVSLKNVDLMYNELNGCSSATSYVLKDYKEIFLIYFTLYYYQTSES